MNETSGTNRLGLNEEADQLIAACAAFAERLKARKAARKADGRDLTAEQFDKLQELRDVFDGLMAGDARKVFAAEAARAGAAIAMADDALRAFNAQESRRGGWAGS